MQNKKMVIRFGIIGLGFALLLSSFYFLCVQYAIETLIFAIIDSLEEGIFSIFISLIAATIFLSITFLFYYVARYIEESNPKKSNVIIRFIFYYLVPIAIYLIIKKHVTEAIPWIVVIISIGVKMLMERLFLKMYKNPK